MKPKVLIIGGLPITPATRQIIRSRLTLRCSDISRLDDLFIICRHVRAFLNASAPLISARTLFNSIEFDRTRFDSIRLDQLDFGDNPLKAVWNLEIDNLHKLLNFLFFAECPSRSSLQPLMATDETAQQRKQYHRNAQHVWSLGYYYSVYY